MLLVLPLFILSPLFGRPEWPNHIDDGERTWVHEILAANEPLTGSEEAQLTALIGGLTEYVDHQLADYVFDGITPWADGTVDIWGESYRWEAVRKPGYFRLLPTTIIGQSDNHPERATRFLKLKAADPLRTDALCVLTVQRAASWIRQHFPAERIDAVRREIRQRLAVDPDDCGAFALKINADHAERRLHGADVRGQLDLLLSQHPDQAEAALQLLRTTTDEEVEAFKRAMGLGLLDYAAIPPPMRKPIR